MNDKDIINLLSFVLSILALYTFTVNQRRKNTKETREAIELSRDLTVLQIKTLVLEQQQENKANIQNNRKDIETIKKELADVQQQVKILTEKQNNNMTRIEKYVHIVDTFFKKEKKD
jgi:hypothetical protein